MRVIYGNMEDKYPQRVKRMTATGRGVNKGFRVAGGELPAEVRKKWLDIEVEDENRG